MSKRLLPTGECWCGCGKETAIGSFFSQGHDKIAESGVILAEFGGVPQFLEKYGYGPGGKNARMALHKARISRSRARGASRT